MIYLVYFEVGLGLSEGQAASTLMQKRHYILLVLILVVYFTGLMVDVMAVDAAQYAEMTLEMIGSKSFLKVFCLGQNYLDKPPLLFWLNSVSFFIFGAGNFSYKLPSLLFALLAIYSTYRFALLYYSRETAMRAALMLATTQALFLITNDVRTDTLLLGSVIFSTWRLAQYLEMGKPRDLLWGCVGIALALLSKGPIGLIVVGAAIVPQIIWKKKWTMFLRREMIYGVGIVALMLLPMCIGLYQQFGVHGLKFYFWTQSFGRITGASQWNNHPDTLFLLHTTAWAFMPWSLFLFPGWGVALVAFVRGRFAMREIISVCGFTLTLIALMLSKYQLPHYIFVVYPLGAVMAADYFERLQQDEPLYKVLAAIQVIILFVIIAAAFLLQYCFKGLDLVSMVCLVVLFPAGIFISLWQSRWRSLFAPSIAVILVFNFLLSAFYFPAIMKYQPGNDIGRYVRTHKTPDNDFVTYQYQVGYEDLFYSRLSLPLQIWDAGRFKDTLDCRMHLMVETSEDGLADLQRAGVNCKIINEYSAFRVSALNLTFLNPATRESVCRKVYLLEVDR
ncbi:MAG: hypothetical protein JWO03_538 [Bacteroidetes bacterium]|nr:hypothetical protein [Bacteroidota bacterium]